MGVSNGDFILWLRGVARIGIVLGAATTLIFCNSTTHGLLWRMISDVAFVKINSGLPQFLTLPVLYIAWWRITKDYFETSRKICQLHCHCLHWMTVMQNVLDQCMVVTCCHVHHTSTDFPVDQTDSHSWCFALIPWPAFSCTDWAWRPSESITGHSG